MAFFTGPISIGDGRFGVPEIFDVLRFRLSGRAGGPAKNARGADGGKKHALETAVFFHEGLVHGFPVGEGGGGIHCFFLAKIKDAKMEDNRGMDMEFLAATGKGRVEYSSASLCAVSR